MTFLTLHDASEFDNGGHVSRALARPPLRVGPSGRGLEAALEYALDMNPGYQHARDIVQALELPEALTARAFSALEELALLGRVLRGRLGFFAARPRTLRARFGRPDGWGVPEGA